MCVPKIHMLVEERGADVSVKRVVDYHIARLQDKRVEVRLDAIRELVLLKSSDALEALQNVFLNDPDDDVRKSAQEAGRLIYKSTKYIGTGGDAKD